MSLTWSLLDANDLKHLHFPIEVHKKRKEVLLTSYKRAPCPCPFLSRQHNIRQSSFLSWKEQEQRGEGEANHDDILRIDLTMFDHHTKRSTHKL